MFWHSFTVQYCYGSSIFEYERSLVQHTLPYGIMIFLCMCQWFASLIVLVLVLLSLSLGFGIVHLWAAYCGLWVLPQYLSSMCTHGPKLWQFVYLVFMRPVCMWVLQFECSSVMHYFPSVHLRCCFQFCVYSVSICHTILLWVSSHLCTCTWSVLSFSSYIDH